MNHRILSAYKILMNIGLIVIAVISIVRHGSALYGTVVCFCAGFHTCTLSKFAYRYTNYKYLTLFSCVWEIKWNWCGSTSCVGTKRLVVECQRLPRKVHCYDKPFRIAVMEDLFLRRKHLLRTVKKCICNILTYKVECKGSYMLRGRKPKTTQNEIDHCVLESSVANGWDRCVVSGGHWAQNVTRYQVRCAGFVV